MFKLSKDDVKIYLHMLSEMKSIFSILESPEQDIQVSNDHLKNLIHMNEVCLEVTGESIFKVGDEGIVLLEVQDEGARQLFLHGYIPFIFIKDFEEISFTKAKKYNDKVWINIQEAFPCS